MFIAIFIVVISGYLAFSVSYNKAYKVKNKIINSIEECEGNYDCFNPKVETYIKQIGYHASSVWNGSDVMKDNGFTDPECPSNLGYCYAKKAVDSSCGTEIGCRYVYGVTTSVTIELPILSTIAPRMKVFTVSGVTSAITEK